MGPGLRRDDEVYSRGMICPSCLQIRCASVNRGRRECRVHAAPAVSCAKNCAFGAHEHTGERKHSDIPCAMALRLTSCSPRWSGLVVTVTSRKTPQGLTPASRRQDHTTWPHTSAFSSGTQKMRLTPNRPSQPRPTHRDDRETPPRVGQGWHDRCQRFARRGKRNIFDSGA